MLIPIAQHSCTSLKFDNQKQIIQLLTSNLGAFFFLPDMLMTENKTSWSGKHSRKIPENDRYKRKANNCDT